MKFSAVHTTVDGTSIDLQFAIDAPGVFGWQAFDPDTGAFLFEGEWSRTERGPVKLRVTLPATEGAYAIRVAPVDDRSRFIQIDACVKIDASVQERAVE